MPEIDDSGGTPPGTSAIHIDVSGLDAFAASVEAELDANFQPQAARLTQVYQLGSHFGLGHASGDVKAAQRKHNECLQAAMKNLIELAKATRVLADAARTVAANYRGADAIAAASAHEAMQALHDIAALGNTVQSAAINIPEAAPDASGAE